MRVVESDGWMELVDKISRHRERAAQMEMLAMAAMLTGDECHIFGRRIRLHIEWIDEQPMTDEQLRAYGQDMKTRAQAKLAELGKDT